LKVVALDQLSGIGLADGVKQPLGVGRAAQKVQRLQHAPYSSSDSKTTVRAFWRVT
jgi:hypothetical protein